MDNLISRSHPFLPILRRFFLRDGMTEAEKDKLASSGADMSKYLPEGNEARIRAAYEHRDPRLTATIITPYAEYHGANNSSEFTYTLRWPYRGFDTADPFDLKTDTNNRFYYLFRKFVAEGASEIPNRKYSPIDVPLIRYADVLLNLAECYNELGEEEKAVDCVNQVRERAGAALLNSNEYTRVKGQDDLRRRIRNERRWEFNGEGINFFDEMCWGTWKESKFFEGAGLKQMWGEPQYLYSWSGKLRVFPAVPDAWAEVAYQDWRAEGAFLVTASRRAGRTEFAAVRSLAGEPCVVVTDMERPVFEGKRSFRVEQVADGTYRIDLRKGEEVLIHPEGAKGPWVVRPLEHGVRNAFGKKARNE